MNKANHRANVVRVGEAIVHPNADTLELLHIEGYQVVVKKGQFKSGDLAVYIQPDSVVPCTEPFKFIWENYEGLDGVVPEKRRRVTVRKFRKEWSEGLLMPINDFSEIMLTTTKEGDDVSELLGITHYEPPVSPQETKGAIAAAPRRRYPKTFKGWFYFLMHKLGLFHQQLTEEMSLHVPAYEVDALKNHRNAFRDGELVIVTEKIHGSNARYLYFDGHMYAGSHYQWKSPKSNCIFRRALEQNPWIEQWCRMNEGFTLYGEVTPTQAAYNYGCKEGEIRFFAFDICTPDGSWIKPDEGLKWTYNMNLVPILYEGPFDLDKIKQLADGPSLVLDAKHVREGVVIHPKEGRRVPGIGHLQLKLISNNFLLKDNA